MPVVSISKDKVDLAKASTVNEINRNFAAELSRHWMTPYGGWKRICKVLEMYSIEVPRVLFQDAEAGEEVVAINQFGHKFGATLDGVVTQPNDQNENEHYLYFNYEIDETGFYKCEAVVTDVEGLEDLIGDDLDNIDEIVGYLPYDEKVIMLDHDDLYSALTRAGQPSSKFKEYFNKLVEYCNTNHIILLRTIGVIFSDEEKRVSDYVG